jgi:hypothetical protein
MRDKRVLQRRRAYVMMCSSFMLRRSLRSIVTGPVLLTFLLSACLRQVTDQTLVAEDHKLLADFNRLEQQYKDHELSPQRYSETLSALHQREEVIFARARSHKFTDMQAANYFFRERLKSPSPISEAQRRFAERESQ